MDLEFKLELQKYNKKDESIDQKNNNSNRNTLNVNNKVFKEFISEKKIKNKIVKENNDKTKPGIFTKNEIPKIIFNKKVLSSSPINRKDSFSFYENFDYQKPQNKYNNHKMKYLFPYYYFFMDCIFDKILHPEKFVFIPKTYFIVYNYMCQIYDISSHIILLKQFNAIKKIIEEKKYDNDNEINSIRKIQKINIRHTKNIEKLDKDLKQRKSVIFNNDLL